MHGTIQPKDLPGKSLAWMVGWLTQVRWQPRIYLYLLIHERFPEV